MPSSALFPPPGEPIRSRVFADSRLDSLITPYHVEELLRRNSQCLVLPRAQGLGQLAGLLIALISLENSRDGVWMPESLPGQFRQISITEQDKIAVRDGLIRCGLIDDQGQVQVNKVLAAKQAGAQLRVLYQENAEQPCQLIKIDSTQVAHFAPGSAVLVDQAQALLLEFQLGFYSPDYYQHLHKGKHLATVLSRKKIVGVVPENMPGAAISECLLLEFVSRMWLANAPESAVDFSHFSPQEQKESHDRFLNVWRQANQESVLWVNKPEAEASSDWSNQVRDLENVITQLVNYAKGSAPEVVRQLATRFSTSPFQFNADKMVGKFAASVEAMNIARDVYHGGRVAGYTTQHACSSEQAIRQLARVILLEQVQAKLKAGLSLRQIFQQGLELEIYYVRSELSINRVQEIFEQEGFLRVQLRTQSQQFTQAMQTPVKATHAKPVDPFKLLRGEVSRRAATLRSPEELEALHRFVLRQCELLATHVNGDLDQAHVQDQLMQRIHSIIDGRLENILDTESRSGCLAIPLEDATVEVVRTHYLRLEEQYGKYFAEQVMVEWQPSEGSEFDPVDLDSFSSRGSDDAMSDRPASLNTAGGFFHSAGRRLADGVRALRELVVGDSTISERELSEMEEGPLLSFDVEADEAGAEASIGMLSPDGDFDGNISLTRS